MLKPDCHLSAYERMQLEFAIAAEVERRCQIREADVRIIDQAPLTVRGKIITTGKLIFCQDDDFRIEYEIYTRKRYFDFLPVAQMMQEAFFENLSREGLVRGGSR